MSKTCGERYERPGGAEPGDRIVRCGLPAGHVSDVHAELDEDGAEICAWLRSLPATMLEPVEFNDDHDEELTSIADRYREQGWLDPTAAQALRTERDELRHTVARLQHLLDGGAAIATQRDALLSVAEAAKAWRSQRNLQYRPGEINPHLLTATHEDLDLARAVDEWQKAAED
jgi:hypothetical protein